MRDFNPNGYYASIPAFLLGMTAFLGPNGDGLVPLGIIAVLSIPWGPCIFLVLEAIVFLALASVDAPMDDLYFPAIFAAIISFTIGVHINFSRIPKRKVDGSNG